MKYTFEFKLDCVDKYKKHATIESPPGVKSKKQFLRYVRDWVKRYEDLGIDGLKHSDTNKKWTAAERFVLVSKVLAGHSMGGVAREAHINVGQLCQWVRKYRESGMGGLECRAGRRPKAPDMPKKKKLKLAPSEREELELLRARNEYLEAENAYLKKLDALVMKRDAAHPKAKKQKQSRG